MAAARHTSAEKKKKKERAVSPYSETALSFFSSSYSFVTFILVTQKVASSEGSGSPRTAPR